MITYLRRRRCRHVLTCVQRGMQGAGRTECKLPAVWLVPWQCVAFSFKWLPHKVIEMWPWSGPLPRFPLPTPRTPSYCTLLQHYPRLGQLAATCLSWQHLKELTTSRDYSVVCTASGLQLVFVVSTPSSSSLSSSSLVIISVVASSFSWLFCRLVSWFSKVAPKWPHFDIFLWLEDGLQLQLGLQLGLCAALVSPRLEREWYMWTLSAINT